MGPRGILAEGRARPIPRPVSALTKKGRLMEVWCVRLSVAEVPGQLLYRLDGTGMRHTVHGTMTKVSDSTATPTPAP